MIAQSRFAFPYPTATARELKNSICWLMLDGERRSVLEIQQALDTHKEIGARIRELRHDGWPFNDARRDGPDRDGVFRYQLDLTACAATNLVASLPAQSAGGLA